MSNRSPALAKSATARVAGRATILTSSGPAPIRATAVRKGADSRSTSTALAAPRETSSMPTAPVPA